MKKKKVTMKDVRKKMREMCIIGFSSLDTFTPEEHMKHLDELQEIRQKRKKRVFNPLQ